MTKSVIDNHKEVCSKLAPEGWSYTGYLNGFYLFQSGDYKEGFREMKLLEEDLTESNITLMALHGMSRY